VLLHQRITVLERAKRLIHALIDGTQRLEC
jgi:hypothetical protein